MDHLIHCPGCRQPLKLPAEAVGKPGHCPHCKAAFDITTTGEVRQRRIIPRGLALAAYAIIMLGLAGTVVNGHYAILCELKPGAELEYARGTVQQQHAIEEVFVKPDEWPYAPYAAVSGAAAGGMTQELVDEELVAARASRVKVLMRLFTAVSLVALVGGVAMARGRMYWLAILGCLAAIVNFNHLCCIPGALAGVLGLLALVRDEGRAYFRR